MLGRLDSFLSFAGGMVYSRVMDTGWLVRGENDVVLIVFLDMTLFCVLASWPWTSIGMQKTRTGTWTAW